MNVKFIWKNGRPEVAKELLHNKNIPVGITILVIYDLLHGSCNQGSCNQSILVLAKKQSNKQKIEQNRNPIFEPHIYSQLIFDN